MRTLPSSPLPFLLHMWILCLLLLPYSLVAGHEGGHSTTTTTSLTGFHVVQDANNCTTVVHDFSPLLHKEKYRVGVYNAEGEETVFAMYDQVFSQYLTATVGRKFDPPIQFEVIPVSLSSAIELANTEQLDFVFGSAAVFSCMATERKAQALVTIISRRQSRGYDYDLDVYGGVMFTMANNREINSIEDFKGRTIGAGHIGGGQTQIYELYRHGLSYVADPKQMVFTKDERQVVQGLLDGDFEIGFARTDQIERHTTEDGTPLHEDTFKIINPQTHVLDDGKLFPFVSSTGLHPEWPLAALDHVDRTVSKEVQEALLAIEDHALADDEDQPNLRCDTTPELAALARRARTNGSFTGFRTARSYFEVRTKQEAAGFIFEAEDEVAPNNLHCILGETETLYHDIQCPDQYYKVTEAEFDNSCQEKGLPCKEGYFCFCQPCVKAFEVDVFQYEGENETETGCAKMSLCGQVQQTKPVTFRMSDHLERDNPEVEVVMHWASDEIQLPVQILDNSTYLYEFDWAHGQMGVGIMEIFFDGQQIPESPMRLQVVERQCDVDYPGRGMVPDEGGSCVCSVNTVSIGQKCVATSSLAIGISVAVVVLLCIALLFYMRYRHRKGDEVWQVHIDELHFDQPVEIIGQGSFGVVVKAEFRGTKVAIKRALKSKRTRGLWSGGSDDRPSDAELDLEKGGSIRIDNIRLDNSNRASVEGSDTNLLPMGDSTRQGDGNVTDLLADSTHTRRDARGSINTPDPTQSLGFLDAEFGGQKNKFAKLLPWNPRNSQVDQSHRQSVAFTATESASQIQSSHVFCPWFDANARQREEFKSEMRILSRLRHPAITTVMGAVVTNTHDPMLVMEYMEYGSLYDLLRNETMYLSGEIILQMARDLAQGIRFLHTSNPPILHGDLKARNILVDSKFRAKICDFGLSTHRHRSRDGISGTPYWLPPEYLRGEKEYDTTCDMYSIGVILYEIFSRKAPYEGEDFKEVIRGVCNRGRNKRPAIPVLTPPKFVALMKKCWSPDPQYRPRAIDFDLALIEMSPSDAELLEEGQQDHKKRAGDMLYELFPKHVADALSKGEKVEPESHELVTIIFSDIIHFTDISRTISPEKVCDMLDRLYHAFDFCARKHKVFKVETIGDAYMGVANLENDQNDTHVKSIAEFAVDMVNEATKIMIDKDDPDRGYINIRVGFHSGPVVSNVIGSLNKRFGLFGDSVNTASRMESNSTANRILCSEISYRLLRRQAPKMMIKKRGKIQVKGKGEMVTFWVGDNLLHANKSKSFRRSTNTMIDSFHEDSGHSERDLTTQETAPTLVPNEILKVEDFPDVKAHIETSEGSKDTVETACNEFMGVNGFKEKKNASFKDERPMPPGGIFKDERPIRPSFEDEKKASFKDERQIHPKAQKRMSKAWVM